MTANNANAPGQAIASCPACSQKLRLPVDRGTLRASCPQCAHVFAWTPPDKALEAAYDVMDAPTDAGAGASGKTSSRPGPMETSTPRKRSGLFILGGSIAFIALATAGVFDGLSSYSFFDMALMITAFAAVYGMYRGVRRLLGWHPVIVVFLVPFLYVGAYGLGYVAMDGDAGERIASFFDDSGGGGAAASSENPFRGRNARNTSVDDLDALMEEW